MRTIQRQDERISVKVFRDWRELQFHIYASFSGAGSRGTLEANCKGEIRVTKDNRVLYYGKVMTVAVAKYNEICDQWRRVK